MRDTDARPRPRVLSSAQPVPDFIDIWYLDKEADPSESTAVDFVIDTVRLEKERLEALEEQIMTEVGPEDARLEAIYEKLDKMDPSTFQKRAGELLFGLGFSQAMMKRKTKDMSGGWRMRVALAQALFVRPMLLVLDEPTNHLDLGACVWLEDYLSTWDSILVLTSHSADFLNGVCSKIYHLTVARTLELYGGNYGSYVKTRQENEVNQQKKYEKEQEDIKHLKEFISSCGTYSNMVKQAQSKQKIIDKMVEAGLTTKVVPDPVFRFGFPNSSKLPPPVLAFQNVSFAYSGKKEDYLYTNLEFGIDCDSRIALVGPNGAGKSTLLKLISLDIEPSEGEIRRNQHLRIGRYNQHSEDVLDLAKNPLDFMRDLYPDGLVTAEGFKKMDIQDWRGKLGIFGVTGEKQTLPMKTMSPGFRARVVFCLMSLRNPHMLLLDEPTNPLDMDMIDSLALAIKNFTGGLVLVSHDFRLLDQVADEIWVYAQPDPAATSLSSLCRAKLDDKSLLPRFRETHEHEPSVSCSRSSCLLAITFRVLRWLCAFPQVRQQGNHAVEGEHPGVQISPSRFAGQAIQKDVHWNGRAVSGALAWARAARRQRRFTGGKGWAMATDGGLCCTAMSARSAWR